MSITFTTKALIAAAEQALKNHDRKRAEWERKQAKYLADGKAAWVRDNRARVAEFRDILTKALKAGGVIERDAVKEAANAGRSGLEGLFYSVPDGYQVKREIGHPPEAFEVNGFRGLIDLLKAHTGDTITANQLKVLGYSNLTVLFNAAVKAGGEAG